MFDPLPRLGLGFPLAIAAIVFGTGFALGKILYNEPNHNQEAQAQELVQQVQEANERLLRLNNQCLEDLRACNLYFGLCIRSRGTP